MKSVPSRTPRRWLLLAGLSGLAACAHAQFDGSEFNSGFVSRARIFFPPILPPLDRPVAHATGAEPKRGAAPAGLAPYIGEFFYPQLATRLFENDALPPKLKAQLDDYTRTKSALLRDLRAELEKDAAAEPAARETALAAFGRRQAPALAQLAASADQLRRSLHQAGRDWGDLRNWHLGDDARRGFSPNEVAQVMRAYAYYQNNLLPAQRPLLLEIALEISGAMDDADKAVKAQPYLYFSPDPARITVPDDVAPEIAAKIAAYQSQKSILKKQLYDAVYTYDGTTMTFLHNPLRALAEKQAAPLRALETLAEDIRRALVVQPFRAAGADKSPLPAALMNRVNALLRNRSAIQRETAAKAEALQHRHTMSPVRTVYRFEGQALRFVVMPARGYRGAAVSDEEKKTIDLVTGEFEALAQEYGDRLAELMTERNALRKSVADLLMTTDETKIDRALTDAARVLQRQENASAYDEYRVAVFQPGLSLEQRRLLLDGATQRLELPLPRGEMQPVRRGNSW